MIFYSNLYTIRCTCIQLRLQKENKYTYRERRLQFFVRFSPKPPSFEDSLENQTQITGTHNGHSIPVVVPAINNRILNPKVVDLQVIV